MSEPTRPPDKAEIDIIRAHAEGGTPPSLWQAKRLLEYVDLKIAKIRELRMVLRRYGDHSLTTCPGVCVENGEHVGIECTCGFWEACGEPRVQKYGGKK